MPVATTARAWLASATPPPTVSPRHPAPSDDAQELPTDGSATNATTRPRREWPQPVPANEQDGCCTSLSCVKKFQADGESFLARTLAKEQEIIRLCATREDRKRFVLDRVPVVRLGHGQGSMIAAGIPVCTRFFKSSFGVSNQVIDACKGTPHARASSNPERTKSRCGIGGFTPKREAALSFVDYWTENFGQFMPDSDLVIIAGASKEEAGGRQDAPDLHAEEDEDDDFAVNGRSHQVTAGATPPPPPPPPPCLPPLRAPSSTTSAMAAASTTSGSGRVPTQGPSIGRPPPSSPTRDATAAAGGDVRTEKPSFNLWGLADLKAEAIRQAGRRKGLKFGPLPGDEVRQISNANRPDLIHALVARVAWRERLNLEPEWSGIRLGVTPEKRKRKQEKVIAKAKKLAGGGVGNKQPRVAKNQGYVCRLVCLTLLEEFYDEYLRSRGGGGTGRSAQDAKEVNERHRFYFLVARAMATVGWKDRNGNVLSVPDDHSTDERAPENLKSLLGNLDLEGAAVSLQEELQTVYQGDADAFHAMLQVKCYEWLKETRSHHTQFKANELQSGGAGADEGEDGNPVDAIHAFEFMGGRVATMIWEDGVRLRGGDDTNESGSAIIPDGQPGAGSSVPGGPGVRGAVSESAAPSSGKDAWGKPKSAKPESIRKGRRRAERAAHGEERAVLVSKANGLLDMLSKSAEQDAKTAEPAFRSLQEGRSKDLAIEELIGDVDRLQRKVDSATSDKARERFQKLLDRAEARLDLADAENEKDEASAAASSSAAASPTTSRPHAPSTPAAAGGGASAGGMPSGHVSSAAAASPTTSLPRAGGGPTDPLPIEELPAIRRALEGLGGDEGL